MLPPLPVTDSALGQSCQSCLANVGLYFVGLGSNLLIVANVCRPGDISDSNSHACFLIAMSSFLCCHFSSTTVSKPTTEEQGLSSVSACLKRPREQRNEHSSLHSPETRTAARGRRFSVDEQEAWSASAQALLVHTYTHTTKPRNTT